MFASPRARRTRQDAGFISVELMIAVALSIVFVVFLCNLIFLQYGKGVLRAAADEGARAGSRVDTSAAVCETRAQSVLESLGTLAHDVTVICGEDVGTQRVVATIDATFEPWMPWVPVVHQHAVGTSVKEQVPQ